jgi:hypothetical protein
VWVQVWRHGDNERDDRWLEYLTVNYNAPRDRRWSFLMVDTGTGQH